MLPRALALALLILPVASYADAVEMGAFDVPSLFHIAKSENRNEVHFAVRLDAQCALREDDAVEAYWRDREVSDSATADLLFIERPAYDLDDLDRVGPYRARFVLRALPQRKVDVEVVRRDDGRCVAKALTTVGGEPARLRQVYVQLSGWSIDYIVIQGNRVRDGALIEERVIP